MFGLPASTFARRDGFHCQRASREACLSQSPSGGTHHCLGWAHLRPSQAGITAHWAPWSLAPQMGTQSQFSKVPNITVVFPKTSTVSLLCGLHGSLHGVWDVVITKSKRDCSSDVGKYMQMGPGSTCLL